MIGLEKGFTPIEVKGIKIPNRIVFPPTDTNFGTADGFVTKMDLDYYERISRGGSGLVIVGASAVTKNGRGFPNVLNVYDDRYINGLKKLFAVIKRNGAIPGLQLSHAGRQAWMPNFEPVAPSPLPCILKSESQGLVMEMTKPRELTLGEIEEIEDAFAAAAVRVKKAGAEFIEFHGCHGYLIHEFLSPLSNKRTDDYGGNLENRARFAVNLIMKTRDSLGERFPLCFRMSADGRIEGDLNLEESKRLAQMLVDAGIDVLHVSSGRFESIDYISPTKNLGECVNVHLAKGIKECVDVPVITVGAIYDLITAEKILCEEKADMVAIGRAQIADPELVNKSKRGEFDSIKKCIRCNECGLSLYMEPGMRCVVNKDLPKIAPDTPRIKV
ncbi:MAG: NADH:flavin oxidoreductase [Candidatus Freyarchaeota archaeon]|nr:NADH:flavin oxidoreductase [Candidatus Jordarchaeia archaeon]MBS7278641.1 NADH:flavin oxidoreductase [Candidatus Jordarchaeia archaeon]